MIEREPKTIRVSPESELALIVAQASASGVPLVVDTGAVAYRLDVRPVSIVNARDQSVDTSMPSPVEFYRELTERSDVREILGRLAR